MNTILYHLRTKFELNRLKRAVNMLFWRNIVELLPGQVEVRAALHPRPYCGDEDDTDGLYHSEAKRGTTAFHAYATLYARVQNKRYTLAMSPSSRRRTADSDSSVFDSRCSTTPDDPSRQNK